MRRLLVHVEGQTEEAFVNKLLCPHLTEYGYDSVSARLLGNARQRRQRGGIRDWAIVRKDIVNHLMYDDGCFAAIMVDFYGLPLTWPGREAAEKLAFKAKARQVADEIANDIRRELGTSFDPTRFIPYIVMHEFEALLFSDCMTFARAIGQPNLGSNFACIRNEYCSPEHINDSPETAPSKRIMSFFKGYNKPSHGVIAAEDIGLEQIRKQCFHFDEWLRKLES
jgi:hypothetical protein